jgi:hypothetical protein
MAEGGQLDADVFKSATKKERAEDLEGGGVSFTAGGVELVKELENSKNIIEEGPDGDLLRQQLWRQQQRHQTRVQMRRRRRRGGGGGQSGPAR